MRKRENFHGYEVARNSQYNIFRYLELLVTPSAQCGAEGSVRLLLNKKWVLLDWSVPNNSNKYTKQFEREKKFESYRSSYKLNLVNIPL